MRAVVARRSEALAGGLSDQYSARCLSTDSTVSAGYVAPRLKSDGKAPLFSIVCMAPAILRGASPAPKKVTLVPDGASAKSRWGGRSAVGSNAYIAPGKGALAMR